MALSRVSPLAVPVLLDIGRESVRSGEDEDALLAEAEAALVAEAMGEARAAAAPREPPARARRASRQRRAPAAAAGASARCSAASRECRADPPRGRAAHARPVGRPVLAGRADSRRLRPAPGEGLVLRPQGMLLPPWDSRVTLDRLALLLRHWRPRIVVALGDSFHDAQGAARLRRERGRTAESDDGGFRVRLGTGQPRPETAGRRSAAGSWRRTRQGRSCSATRRRAARAAKSAVITTRRRRSPPAAATSAAPASSPTARRLMLPAFGAYTGGLDVRHPAITALFPRGGRVFLLGRERLFSFPLSVR